MAPNDGKGEDTPKEKTINDLKMHEMLIIDNDIIATVENDVEKTIERKIEITRVPGGFVYAFDYPGYRQCVPLFIPEVKKTINKAKNK